MMNTINYTYKLTPPILWIKYGKVNMPYKTKEYVLISLRMPFCYSSPGINRYVLSI
jgi:hypothetical protein